ncbi:uncharacterized protein LOC122001022 [Zingiber officinale]|nr:uncharacterized protein LOC122001022 [Zingiber officinale]
MDQQSCESDGSMFSSSSDLTDDALSTEGPLFELSATLMAVLPIKRGLSKYFQGKSQSFASLSRATCIEDLAKKEAPAWNNKKGMKAWKISGGGFTPGPCSRTITKKSSRGSCASSAARRGRH